MFSYSPKFWRMFSRLVARELMNDAGKVYLFFVSSVLPPPKESLQISATDDGGCSELYYTVMMCWLDFLRDTFWRNDHVVVVVPSFWLPTSSFRVVSSHEPDLWRGPADSIPPTNNRWKWSELPYAVSASRHTSSCNPNGIILDQPKKRVRIAPYLRMRI